MTIMVIVLKINSDVLFFFLWKIAFVLFPLFVFFSTFPFNAVDFHFVLRTFFFFFPSFSLPVEGAKLFLVININSQKDSV